VGSRLRGRLRESDAVSSKEAVEGAFAIKDEIGNRAMEEGHHKSENQICEIRNHLFESNNLCISSNRAKNLVLSDMQ
jgi:hypothetical protein